ncbi:MAG: type II toxin-antitoxin system VapC family toxin [Emticicia sp.]
MKIFLDTSSLVKLYHRETGTQELEKLFSSYKITAVFLSEIAKIEFASTIWKKVRTKEITELEAQITLELFETDFEKYTFIATDSIVLETGRTLTTKYGMQGLRTLDSIQFSTAISLARQADVFFTADKLLKSFFETEGLSTEVVL